MIYLAMITYIHVYICIYFACRRGGGTAIKGSRVYYELLEARFPQHLLKIWKCVCAGVCMCVCVCACVCACVCERLTIFQMCRRVASPGIF